MFIGLDWLMRARRLAATLLAGAETAADLATGLLTTAKLHVGLGLHGLSQVMLVSCDLKSTTQ
jgi:hypothetical protein